MLYVGRLYRVKGCQKFFCAPGNGGTEDISENIDIDVDEIDKLVNFALKESIDITIVGPEGPLVKGIVDKFKAKGLRIFGANKKAAQLEGSKVFAKKFMENIIFLLPDIEYIGI